MASIDMNGLEELSLSMQEIADIPDEVISEMLLSGAEVVVTAQKRKIQSLGLVDSGRLANSIRAFLKRGKAGGEWKRYVLVYPYGKHGDRKRKKVTKEYKNSKHGRTYTVGGDIKPVTNNEVGFIHEYGAPKRGIRAKQWMRQANEESSEEAVQAQMRVYDAWLKSKNL